MAGFLEPSGGLNLGLDRERLARAGYRLRYLVHMGADAPAEPVLDVRGVEEEQLRELAKERIYAIFERTGERVDGEGPVHPDCGPPALTARPRTTM